MTTLRQLWDSFQITLSQLLDTFMTSLGYFSDNFGITLRGWSRGKRQGAAEEVDNERADERLMACCLPASPNLEHSKSFLDARINFRFRPKALPDLR